MQRCGPGKLCLSAPSWKKYDSCICAMEKPETSAFPDMQGCPLSRLEMTHVWETLMERDVLENAVTTLLLKKAQREKFWVLNLSVRTIRISKLMLSSHLKTTLKTASGSFLTSRTKSCLALDSYFLQWHDPNRRNGESLSSSSFQ